MTFTEAWATVKQWTLAWFFRPKPEPEPIKPKSDELWIGESYDDAVPVEDWMDDSYRTDFTSHPQLLDLLPRARRIVQKLAKVDRDGYNIYRRLGARLVCRTGESRYIVMGTLKGDFFDILPAQGLVFIVTERWNKQDKRLADFVYVCFQKLERRPWEVEAPPAGARAIYQVTLIHDDDTRRVKDTTGYIFHVAVLANRHVVALREWQCDTQYIMSRRNDDGRSCKPLAFSLRQPARWAYPIQLERHVRQMKKDEPDEWTSDLAVEHFGGALFNGAANLYDDSTERLQATCERDGVAMTFSIDNRIAPRFFRNRDLETNERGHRLRIFHAVEEHLRTLPTGKVIKVRSHYKGTRIFTWKGERIRIAPPEQSAKFWNVGGIPAEMIEDKQTTYSGPLTAMKVRDLWEKQAQQRGGYRTRKVNPMEVARDREVRDIKHHAAADHRAHVGAKDRFDYQERHRETLQ